MKYGILFILFLSLSLSVLSSNVKMDVYFEKIILEEELQRKLNENQKFKTALGFRESSMRPNIINPIGAMGIWQFMPETLKDLGLGHITPSSFRNNPEIFPIELQEYALDLKIERDLRLLTHQWWRGNRSINYIEKFVGTKVYGVEITLSGIIAAAHIGGAGGVIRFFDTMGMYNPSDMFGTSLFSYMREFSNYEFNYHNILNLKTRIECLEKSLIVLEKSILLSKQSVLSFSELNLKEMGTVLTLNFQKIFTQIQKEQKSHLYLSDLKPNYLSITGEYYFSEVPHLSNIITICLQGTEKLSGIIQKNGMELLKHSQARIMQKKEIDYFNFILSQYGMHRGTSNYSTSFQYLGLKKLTNFPHLGVA